MISRLGLNLQLQVRIVNMDQVQAATAAMQSLVEADPSITDGQIAEQVAQILSTLRAEYAIAGLWHPLPLDMSKYRVEVIDRQSSLISPKEG